MILTRQFEKVFFSVLKEGWTCMNDYLVNGEKLDNANGNGDAGVHEEEPDIFCGFSMKRNECKDNYIMTVKEIPLDILLL